MRRSITWRDIKDAPKDGTVIVTNDGTGTFYEGRWYLCQPNGCMPSCNEYGKEVSEIEPTMWFKYPW